MKKNLITVFAACACGLALAIGATQEWVMDYVARTMPVQSNTVYGTSYTSGSGTHAVTLTKETPSVYALMATNATVSATALGVTNGMYFVWNETSHSYTNRTQTITATSSNLVWRTHSTTNFNFSGYFAVVGRIIQPTFSQEVTK